MSKCIDLSRPFIAIRQDESGGECDPTMAEYFCNPLPYDLFDVTISTGGISCEADLITNASAENTKVAPVLTSGSVLRVVVAAPDEYDGMAVHWSVCYRTPSGESVAVDFSTQKRLAGAEAIDNVPILGGLALIVPRDA